MGILFIGYGNPLREDDGVGWAAAEMLFHTDHRSRFTAHDSRLTVETTHQLLPELADSISQADLVIFVDAAVDGEPGEIRCQVVRPFPQPPGAFSHHVSPAGLLQMAQELYGRCPPAYLFTVTAASMGFDEGLSPAVTAALPELLWQIEEVMGGA